jgi:DNA mismatch repair protein MutS
VVFLHHIQDGPANRSFGLQVAKLAGIPSQVLQAAGEKLKELEDAKPSGGQGSTEHFVEARGRVADPVEPRPSVAGSPPSPQVDLFSGPASHPIVDDLEALDIDDLSPRQALEKLYELKRKL